MAYYKIRIEVWCDWDPVASELEESDGTPSSQVGVGLGERMIERKALSSTTRKVGREG